MMIQFFLFVMMFMFSFILYFLSHPLALGMMLMIQTLLISLLIGLMNESFWFSYILFLVFLGGMLILFIYVTSLASNEKFYFSFKLMLVMFMSMMVLMFLFNILDLFIMNFMNNNESLFSNFYMMFSENSMTIFKLYNFPTNLITLMLMNYLFFLLIVIVKITNFFFGPLRNLK